MANLYKNKVVYGGDVLIDLSGDTVTSPVHIASGKIGHLADGSQVTGTGPDTSDATAAAGDIRDGETAYVNGVKITGIVTERDSTDLTASGDTVTVPAGIYDAAATKTIASGSATTPATTVTANPSISVNSSGLITATASATKSVTPTVSAGYVSSGTAGTITVSGSNTQQLTTQAAQTIYPSTTDQTIASGKYLTGAQTVKAVTTTNLSAEYIKSGVTVQVGDSADSDRIASVTGTYAVSGTLESIEVTTPPTKTLYSAGENFDPTGMVITATYSSTDDVNGYTYPSTALTEGQTSVVITYTENGVTVTTPCAFRIIGTLEKTDWDIISEVAQAGNAASYWDIGDTKSVKLSGTCGTLTLDTTLYVYIIGINHQDVNGITFQGFKTAASDGVDVCLVDSNYNGASYGGKEWLSLNHWGGGTSPYATNYGGWKACDARYDILGSTDTAPSGYGAIKTTSAVGYDASSTTATSPVAETLMSCLPSDLRAVMQPMTVYTDNTGNKSNVQANVTTSVDYLPLLAEYEIFGTRTYANQYEQNQQAQYAYYSAGNSKVKYKHSSTETTAGWWERSPVYSNIYRFCGVSTNGTASYNNSATSFGVAPAFRV